MQQAKGGARLRVGPSQKCPLHTVYTGTRGLSVPEAQQGSKSRAKEQAGGSVGKQGVKAFRVLEGSVGQGYGSVVLL